MSRAQEPRHRPAGSSAQGLTRLKSKLTRDCDSYLGEAPSPLPASQGAGGAPFLVAVGLRCVFLS